VNGVFASISVQSIVLLTKIINWRIIQGVISKFRSFKNISSPSKGRYTLDIFTHNIATKRYCDKKIIFEPWMSKGHGKLLTKISSRYITFFTELTLVFKSLPWLA